MPKLNKELYWLAKSGNVLLRLEKNTALARNFKHGKDKSHIKKGASVSKGDVRERNYCALIVRTSMHPRGSHRNVKQNTTPTLEKKGLQQESLLIGSVRNYL